MAHHAFSVPYACISAMFGLALVAVGLRHRNGNLRSLVAKAALAVSGHLRHRPDQAMEHTLRSAFRQLDDELAAVLGDRTLRCSATGRCGVRACGEPPAPAASPRQRRAW